VEIDQFILEPSLGLPSVGQLGFIVHDIQRYLPSVASAFNLKTWYEPQYSEKQFKIGGGIVELDFNLAFAYSGKLQIELVEEKSQRAPIYKDHLDSYGQGLHHLGFYVPDLDAKLTIARQLGLGILLEGQFTTAGGGDARFAYLDTRQMCGIIVELINIKLYGINVPQTEFMMKVGGVTGDVLKLDV
jgi:catechol 2,3-dioxygenase-like lactoylglutathione lyase family enzyme